ncbi:MAG: uridine phosphorylase [Chloroflexi bacterium]|nr:MAG: uridine phosphorylase [Chloroflexota bacterium]
MTHERFYHIGYGRGDFGAAQPTMALLSGDPERAAMIAQKYLSNVTVLSDHRGLHSSLGYLPNGTPVISATSGMGAPSLSIVVNELVQVGIRTIIRVGTCGSIQPQVLPGHVVVSQAALCRQGAASDIAPLEYPAAADPYVTIALMEAAHAAGIPAHMGVTASVDTFYEGQERHASANPHLLRRHIGATAEYQHLNVLNYEMEAGTLFKMGLVYGFAAGCVCAAVAQRTTAETIVLDQKAEGVDRAIRTAVAALTRLAVR